MTITIVNTFYGLCHFHLYSHYSNSFQNPLFWQNTYSNRVSLAQGDVKSFAIFESFPSVLACVLIWLPIKIVTYCCVSLSEYRHILASFKIYKIFFFYEKRTFHYMHTQFILKFIFKKLIYKEFFKNH